MKSAKISSTAVFTMVVLILVIYLSSYIYDEILELTFFYSVLMAVSVFFICVLERVKQSELKAKINEERFRVILTHIKEAMFDNVLEGDITNDIPFGMNLRMLGKRLGLPLEETTYDMLINAIADNMVHPDFREEYKQVLCRNNILKVFYLGGKSIEYECIERSDGIHYRWIRIHLCIFYSNITQTIRVISFVKDIQDKKREMMLLKEKAEHDLLTGLLNKVSAENHINLVLSMLKDDVNYAFMMMDMDNFKFVNDALGHAAGDKVLVEVAEKMRSIFSDDAIIGRVGGDEFCLLLVGIDEAVMRSKIHSLNFALQKIGNEMQATRPLSFSFGVVYTNVASTYDELYRRADKVLYDSKDNGKNQYTFYYDIK
jgi:diguanylate cyclase (GGDEF)-like protein